MTLAEIINSWETDGKPDIFIPDFGDTGFGSGEIWFINPKTGKVIRKIINIKGA